MGRFASNIPNEWVPEVSIEFTLWEASYKGRIREIPIINKQGKVTGYVCQIIPCEPLDLSRRLVRRCTVFMLSPLVLLFDCIICDNPLLLIEARGHKIPILPDLITKGAE